jgi:predicted RND superfamily exporter protein
MNAKNISGHLRANDTFFARLAECILRWRWFILLMVSVTTIFAFHEMRKIKMDKRCVK